jgi:serine/threonine protein kinase
MRNLRDIAAARGATAERLQRSWDELCAQHLSLTDGESIWRYNRDGRAGDLDQGWKLHVSATILNAAEILRRIAPLLVACGVQFKAARSLKDVGSLNSGLLGTYSQVGKIITVYPRSDEEAVYLAKRLHKLTYRFRAPSVPFDLRFGETSNIYYRYGAFKKIELERNGKLLSAVRSASGELVPDVREHPRPDWVCDPFQSSQPTSRPPKSDSELTGAFRVLRALVQRGKGGVYQAIDIQSTPPRLCLLKEGRRRGEINWDGRDGAWRVRHEQRVLSQLLRCGLSVPHVYARFEVEGNVYLAMEFIDGDSLQNFLLKRKRRLSIEGVLTFGIEIAAFLAQMHRAGWAWRDCKPMNLIVNREGRLVPIDFEGAEQIVRPDPLMWGTPGFIPRAARAQKSHTGVTDDLYALGSILFLLISGQIFDETQRIPISRLRRHVPIELQRLVASLLTVEPQERPTARQAQTQLESILLQRSWKRLNLRAGKAA